MKVRFVYPRFKRHAEAHPELLDSVPCNEYFGPPSLGIACMAAMTPPDWELDFRDDRVEDVGLDDDGIDLVAISFFTPAATRAMHLGDEFRKRGRKVVMGGIFPTMMPDLAQPHADAIVEGAGEGVWLEVLADVKRGALKPRYKETVPFDLAQLPQPRVDLYLAKEGGAYRPDDYPVQTSRGCPLKCNACVLPTSMGRALRHVPVDHVIGQLATLGKVGKLASFTEDTSFFFGSGAQRRFGELLDIMGERQDLARVSYVGTSMALLLATPEPFLGKLKRAGLSMFYLVGGFDPITMNAFSGKDPKAYTRAVDCIKRAHDAGIEPYTSFLVGNDGDDEGVFERMIEFANATKIRKAEFAILTPYPGTPIWHRFEAEGRIIDRNWTNYNDANVTFRPAQMSPERLLEGYLYLWREFYKPRQDLRSLDHDARTIQF